MLTEAKKAMRVTVDEYDSEIASLLTAGAKELQALGVILPGTVSFGYGTGDAVTDNSTLTDALAMRAIITYAAMRFGNPPNYEQLRQAYEEQKGFLMHSSWYTVYGGDMGC